MCVCVAAGGTIKRHGMRLNRLNVKEQKMNPVGPRSGHCCEYMSFDCNALDQLELCFECNQGISAVLST